MKNVMKSKATERSFNESWKKFVKHLIVEHLKRCGYTITILRSNLLIACIIQENQNLLDEVEKDAKAVPRLTRVTNQRKRL